MSQYEDENLKIFLESMEKQRGHADFFDFPYKSSKEWGISETFREELEREKGPKIVARDLHPGGANHAPDLKAITDTEEIWGIEITELVSREAIEATKHGKFFYPEWTDADLITKFEALVSKKDKPREVNGGPYDRYVLLVHVDEDMLSASRLKKVFGSHSFQTCLIDDVYVLVSYDPREERCPLLHLVPAKTDPNFPKKGLSVIFTAARRDSKPAADHPI